MHGIGLRTKHYGSLLTDRFPLDCAEVITENFMDRGGRPRAVLEKVRREVPIFLHGVSLSLGGSDPLNPGYLESLARMCHELEPAIVSDHLSFGTVEGLYAHDLWPMPYTGEAIAHVAERVAIVQDALKRRILIENVSSYIEYRASAMNEWDFVAAVAARADCDVLLDINNIYVSARNHGFSPERYIDAIPPERVRQYHLAGHLDRGEFLLDNHGGPISTAVMNLYEYALRQCGPRPTILEWDEALPTLEVLLEEARRAKAIEATQRGFAHAAG